MALLLLLGYGKQSKGFNNCLSCLFWSAFPRVMFLPPAYHLPEGS